MPDASAAVQQRDWGTNAFAPWRRVDRRFLYFLGCSHMSALHHMEAIALSGAQEGVEERGSGLACDGHARNEDFLPEGPVERGVARWV